MLSLILLVEHCWEIGEYISQKLASAEWGDGVVKALAAELARRYPGARGLDRTFFGCASSTRRTGQIEKSQRC